MLRLSGLLCCWAARGVAAKGYPQEISTIRFGEVTGADAGGIKLDGTMKARALNSYNRVLEVETKLHLPAPATDGHIYSVFLQLEDPLVESRYENFVCAYKHDEAGQP